MKSVLLCALSIVFITGCSSKWEAVNKKIVQLQHLEISKNILEQEHMELKGEYEKLKYSYNQLLAQHKIEAQLDRNLKLHGSEQSRSIASIEFQVDTSKDYKVLYSESLVWINAGEYDKAAKTLSYLAESYKWKHRWKAYYPLGIALYRLNNFYGSLAAFNKVSNLNQKPRVLAWKSLIYKNLGNIAMYKKTVNEMARKYPDKKVTYFMGKRSLATVGEK